MAVTQAAACASTLEVSLASALVRARACACAARMAARRACNADGSESVCIADARVTASAFFKAAATDAAISSPAAPTAIVDSAAGAVSMRLPIDDGMAWAAHVRRSKQNRR